RADVPIAQTVAHPNYETLADHYHDNRDLANTITWLRYAVNERPRDIPLRHKLILAYQERKMPEAALAEISRALQIAPNDGGLYRAYGETLMNKGEVPAAEKAFRDAVRLNADDIPARIALGDALMLDNQYADALDTYAAAQKADPRSPLPHRRLARVFLLRAAADPTQYAASLDEIATARQLTPANDKNTYQVDYGTLMAITEARLRELLEEVSGNFIAMNKGKQSGNDTLRALSDMQVRTDALSNYLDKAPEAQGQEVTKIRYQQAATFLLSSITLFRNYLNKNDPTVKQQMQDASAQSYQELDAAHKRLADIRAALIPR
ncbi:MAG: Cytochrome c biosis factor, partial [Chthonomonadaceae bacterium]|nr:Cytochrome c biosis factor [Chthonomonadaceae bacterium]